MDDKNLKIFFMVSGLIFCIIGVLLIYHAKETNIPLLSVSGGVICLIIGFIMCSMAMKKRFDYNRL